MSGVTKLLLSSTVIFFMLAAIHYVGWAGYIGGLAMTLLYAVWFVASVVWIVRLCNRLAAAGYP